MRIDHKRVIVKHPLMIYEHKLKPEESTLDWSLQKRQPDHRGTTWMFLLTAVGSIAGVIAFIILAAWIDAHPYIVATVVLGLAGVAFIFIHRLEKKWKEKNNL